MVGNGDLLPMNPFLQLAQTGAHRHFLSVLVDGPGGRVARELELERILILIDFCAVFLILQTAKQPKIIHTAIMQHIKNKNTEMLSSAIFVLYRAKLKQKWCAGKVFSKW
jgi:hypothetical protein